MASTDDEEESISDEAGEGEEGLDADYGSENEESDDGKGDGYEFEKEGAKSKKSKKAKSGLDLEGEKDEGGIFDKEAGDSDVEEFMEGIENEQMDLDGLVLPSDAEESDLDADDDGPGLFNEYDDEEDFGKGIKDDYDGEDDDDEAEKDGDSKDGGEEDGEEELDDVFARAAEEKEMDVVENIRQQAENV